MWGWFKKGSTETERLLDTIAFRLEEQNTLMLELISNSKRALDREQLKDSQVVAAVEKQVSHLVESLSGEPFKALKKWIDVASGEISRRDEIERNYRERERQLLSRWNSQVRDLQGRIESLERQIGQGVSITG